MNRHSQEFPGKSWPGSLLSTLLHWLNSLLEAVLVIFFIPRRMWVEKTLPHSDRAEIHVSKAMLRREDQAGLGGRRAGTHESRQDPTES